MDWIGIVVAGVVATAVITILMYGGPMMGMHRMNIAQLLGSMALPQGNLAFAMGMMAHFVMGIIFAAIYAAVWLALGIGVTWWSGLIFGLVHAMVAAGGMAVMMPVHKEVSAGLLESPLAVGPKGMIGMVIGHLVFGLVVALVYRSFV